MRVITAPDHDLSGVTVMMMTQHIPSICMYFSQRSDTWYIVYSALTSTYIATKKEKKKKTPQERVSSSLEESSVSGPTWRGMKMSECSAHMRMTDD